MAKICNYLYWEKSCGLSISAMTSDLWPMISQITYHVDIEEISVTTITVPAYKKSIRCKSLPLLYDFWRLWNYLDLSPRGAHSRYKCTKRRSVYLLYVWLLEKKMFCPIIYGIFLWGTRMHLGPWNVIPSLFRQSYCKLFSLFGIFQQVADWHSDQEIDGNCCHKNNPQTEKTTRGTSAWNRPLSSYDYYSSIHHYHICYSS